MIKSYIIECDFCKTIFEHEYSHECSAACNYRYNGFDCHSQKHFCESCEDEAKIYLDSTIAETNENFHGKALIRTSLGLNSYKEIIPELSFL